MHKSDCYKGASFSNLSSSFEDVKVVVFFEQSFFFRPRDFCLIVMFFLRMVLTAYFKRYILAKREF